ncbi:MAG: ribonuclease PH [Candidatus Omnitrophica bacterium]|nr:ribonuclease PH [Candidatus Omnitrophota bacterium]
MANTIQKQKTVRAPNSLRKVHIRKGVLKYANGSCLIESGDTKVICSASVENSVPPFLRGSGKGWVTAEYGMLPASCAERIARERNKVSGRTQEIQRLIGRALRSVVDLNLLGERTITVDADVIQGDGGTRTAAITGCFVALGQAVENLLSRGALAVNPIKDFVAAVSVGMVRGKPVLDLDYELDSSADVDMNIVMTGDGRLVEVQGTAERTPFDEKQLMVLLQLAKKGISKLIAHQRRLVKI